MVEPTTGEYVYAEQVRQLYRLSRPAYIGTLLNSSILVYALWGLVSITLLGTWLCAMFALTGARYLLYRSYRGLQPPAGAARVWARRFVAGSGTAGLMWGVAGSVLYPAASLPHQFLVIFLIGGMALAAMVVLAPVRQAALTFVLPALLLTTATVFYQDTTLHVFMGVLMVVLIAVILGTVPALSQMMSDALRVKFENMTLVGQLSQANRDLSEHVAAQRRSEEELRQSEQRYRYMFEANPLPMWIRDEESLRILEANDAALRTYGYSREEFFNLKWGDLHLGGDAERFREVMRTRDPSQGYTNYWHHRRKDGTAMNVETVSHPFSIDGRSARLVLVNDITERKRAEQRLQMGHTITRILAESRSVEEALRQALRTICESSGWVYGQRWALNKPANLLQCAETWCAADRGLEEFEGYNRERMQTPGSGHGLIHRVWESNGPVWLVDLAQETQMARAPAALKAGLRSAFAFPILVGDGFYGVMEFFGRDARQPDAELVDIVHTIGSQVGQFMARKIAEENLRFVASHDPLTGLFNRSIFNERLHQALAQAARFERSLALLFIDLDGFKLVNDTLGHNAGDALLAELATRLRATLREGDVIGRMGGDEFVVLIEEFGEANQVARVAKKVLETVARPFLLQGREFEVTASLGVSLYPEDGKDAQALIKNADIAMYLVKQQGKNGFRFYAPQMNVHLLERLSLESSLRHAMERGELLHQYQPKGSASVTDT